MMHSHFHIWIKLFLCGLLLKSGSGDISLTLRKGGRAGNAYLPPNVKEQYYQIQEAEPSSKFEESSYGSSRYHIFEVHTNYEVPRSRGQPTADNNAGQQSHTQEIRISAQQAKHNLNAQILKLAGVDTNGGQQKIKIEHVNSASAATAAPAPPIAVPFPSNFQHDFQKENNRRGRRLEEAVHQTVPRISRPAALTQEQGLEHYTLQAAAAPSQVQSLQAELGASNPAPAAEFRAADYLPPQREEHEHNPELASQPFQAQPEYQSPAHSQAQTFSQSEYQQHQSAPFKAPDYLPPQGNGIADHFGSPGKPPAISDNYQAPGYLPPLSSPIQSNEHLNHHQPQVQPVAPLNYQAPVYLPSKDVPQDDQHQPNQVFHNQQPFKGSDYLPPTSNYRGPDYLPPNDNSVQQQNEQQQLYKEVPQQTPFKGPDYLPPGNPGENQQSGATAVGETPDVSNTEHYSAAYDFGNSKAPQSLLQEPQQVYQPQPAPQSLPQTAFQPQVFTSLTESAPNSQPAGYDLPSGYDFQKPENAEAAIAELHRLPQEQFEQTQGLEQQQQQFPQSVHQPHQQLSQQDIGDNNRQAHAIYGQPPQQSAPQTQNQYQPSPPQQPFSAPDYLPPVESNFVQPPTQQNLHPLSSYMTTVQPYATRYGDSQYAEPRRPFDKYGPPPSSTQAAAAPHTAASIYSTQPQAFPQPTPDDVSSMYSQQRTLPQYYASATGYNAASAQTYANSQQQLPKATYALSQEAKQSLQQAMPKDVQQQLNLAPAAAISTPTAALPSSAPTVASNPSTVVQNRPLKIHTVQIVKSQAIKTLKVLETLDQAGVKTIKILGQSNENPMGAHRVVKVVSQSQTASGRPQENVQTLKIFNDQNQILPAAAATTITAVSTNNNNNNNNNAYLPPNAALAAVKRTIRRIVQQ